VPLTTKKVTAMTCWALLASWQEWRLKASTDSLAEFLYGLIGLR
jgi:hypothetical protein